MSRQPGTGRDEIRNAVQAGWAAASADDAGATVSYFAGLLSRHPGDASALLGYASALDFADREAQAAPVYEQALSAGLAGDELRQALTQYGSTLRNIGRHDEAVSVLRDAERKFPGHDSVTLFLALALASAGRGSEAAARLITLALDRIDADDLADYRRALRHYAAELAEQD